MYLEITVQIRGTAGTVKPRKQIPHYPRARTLLSSLRLDFTLLELPERQVIMAQVTKKSSSTVKDNFYPIVAVAIVLLGIFFVINSNNPSTSNTSENTASESAAPESTQSAKPKTLAYRGQEGKTALAILKEVAQIETSGEGAMTFVTTINGYKPDVNKEFWALYVNGKQSEVGAGSYSTKSTDLIEWRLEEIKL